MRHGYSGNFEEIEKKKLPKKAAEIDITDNKTKVVDTDDGYSIFIDTIILDCKLNEMDRMKRNTNVCSSVAS